MMKDTTWTVLVACVFAMFIVALLAFGAPTGGGGIAGNGLVLARYAGFVLAPLLLGLLVVGVLWLINRVSRKTYLTPKRDMLVVAVAFFFFALQGSHRLSAPALALAGLCCFLFIAFLLLRHRLRRPTLGSTVSVLVGICTVMLPLACIAASVWLLNYSFLGGAVLFVVGAVWLLYLFLHDSRGKAKSERT